MNSRRPGFRPPAPPRPHRHEPVVYLRRRILTVAAILTVIVVGYYGITLGAALTGRILQLVQLSGGAQMDLAF